MCLGENLGQEALEEYRKTYKNGYIKVWKVVNIKNKRYYPEIYDFKPFRIGLNIARKSATNEDKLIHAFRNEESAKRWRSFDQAILQCYVKPKWVMAVGITTNENLTLTTKAIVIPKNPETKVTLKEFRKVVKGRKIPIYNWEK